MIDRNIKIPVHSLIVSFCLALASIATANTTIDYCPTQKNIESLNNQQAIDFVYDQILLPGAFGLEMSYTEGLVFESKDISKGNTDFLDLVPQLNQDLVSSMGGEYNPARDYSGFFKVSYVESSALECRRQIYLTDVNVKTGEFSGYSNVEICNPHIRNLFFAGHEFYSKNKEKMGSLEKFFEFIDQVLLQKQGLANQPGASKASEVQAKEFAFLVQQIKGNLTISDDQKDQVYYQKIDGNIFPRFGVRINRLTFTETESGMGEGGNVCKMTTEHAAAQYIDLLPEEKHEFSDYNQSQAFESSQADYSDIDPDMLMMMRPFALKYWDETDEKTPVSENYPPNIIKSFSK